MDQAGARPAWLGQNRAGTFSDSGDNVAINVGTLTALLKLDASGFAKGATTALKETEKLAKGFEQIGKKAAQLGAAMTAPVVLALRAAAKHSPEVQAQLDRVNRAFAALAEQVARAVLPVVRQFADGIASVARWLNDMNPETKKAVAHYAELAAKVALAVAAFGQVAGVVGTVAKLGTLLLGPFGMALAAAAALVVAAALVTQAWEDNLLGIREKFAAVWGWITSKVSVVGDAFASVLKFVVGIFAGTLRTLGDAWAGFLKFIGKDAPDSGGLFKDLADWMEHLTTRNGLVEMVDDFRDTWSSASAYVNKSLDTLQAKAAKLVEELRKQFQSGEGLYAASESEKEIRARLEPVERASGVAGPSMEHAQSMMDRARAQPITMQVHNDAVARADQAMNDLATTVGSKLVSRLGTAGSLANSAAEGMATAGPWGALISVFADIVSRSKQFSDAVAYLEDGCKMIADSFGRIFGSGSKINAASNDLIAGILDVFNPLFDAISDIVGVIAPVIQVVQKTLAPAFAVLGVVFKGVGLVLKGVASVLLGVLMALASVYNGVLEVVASVIEIFDGNAARDFRKNKADTAAIQKQMDDLWKPATDAQDHLADSAGNAAEAADKLTQSLTNVPTGFKVAQARFDSIVAGLGGSTVAAAAGTSTPPAVSAAVAAIDGVAARDQEQREQRLPAHKRSRNARDDAEDIPHFAAGGIVTRPTIALIGEAGPEAVVPLSGGAGGAGITIQNLTVVANDPDQLVRQLKRANRRNGFRQQ